MVFSLLAFEFFIVSKKQADVVIGGRVTWPVIEKEGVIEKARAACY